jgi:hypothetical protein
MSRNKKIADAVELAAQAVYEYGSTDSEVLRDLYDCGEDNTFSAGELEDAALYLEKLGRMGMGEDAAIDVAKRDLAKGRIETQLSVLLCDVDDFRARAARIGVLARACGKTPYSQVFAVKHYKAVIDWLATGGVR